MPSVPYRKPIVAGIKLLIFAGLSALLYKQVVQHREFDEVARIFRDGLSRANAFILAALLLAMALNWTLETVKWRSLVQKLEPAGFFTALKGVLFGVAFSLFTPNRVGEFGGRVIALPEKRGPAIVAALLGSLGQITMNLVLGGLGLIIYAFTHGVYGYLAFIVLFLWVLMAAVLFIVYFNLDIAEGALLKIPLLRKVKEHIDLVLRYSRRELAGYLFLSGARCLVYYFQFWLCLQFFGIDLALAPAMVLIAAIYFVQTVIPTFAVVELVFRGNVAVSFLAGLTANTAGVFSATFLIWVVNLIVPALAGLALFTRHRLITERS